MKRTPLIRDAALWAGCTDLEVSGDAVTPWRGALADRHLYAPELVSKMTMPSGVRIACRSDTRRLTLNLAQPCFADDPAHFELLVDGQPHQRRTLGESDRTVAFDDIPAGMHRLELYLPLFAHVVASELSIDDEASIEPCDDPRPKWITHGSSITMCRAAGHPTCAWPALVADALGLNHTNLGFGGQCKVETLVARTIARQPADAISLCLGINVHGGDLSARTFRPAAAGFILTVRDGHPTTPLVLCSPIFSQQRERAPGASGLTLTRMREELRSLVDDLRRRGDDHIHYVDGLDLFGPELAHHEPDGLHPDRQGYALLAQNFITHAAPKLGLKRPS